MKQVLCFYALIRFFRCLSLKFAWALLLWIISHMAAAQSFIRGQQRTVSTADITSDAFTFLNMSGEKNTTLNPNLPFVQLYQIIENNGRIHHLVIQKNKELQLTAFGIENGLMPFFTCKEKWLLPIGACIQQNHSVAFGEIDEAVYVACIVDRLNRCR